MLVLKKRKHGINFYTVWFAERPIAEKGIVAYYEAQFTSRGPCSQYTEFPTLINDLSETEDEIKQHFSKSCKYKINRAAREDVDMKVYDSDEITEEQIDRFIAFFEKFWETKDSQLENKEKLKEELFDYKDKQALLLGIAYVKGTEAVYHVYVGDGYQVRLLHSASLYRQQGEEESNVKNLIGMANRALHFEEMKSFKQKGYQIYDWGGAGKTEEVLAITEFKESFGGREVMYHNFEETTGIRAKLFRLAAKILGR